jgi:hypothetical protein
MVFYWHIRAANSGETGFYAGKNRLSLVSLMMIQIAIQKLINRSHLHAWVKAKDDPGRPYGHETTPLGNRIPIKTRKK